MQDCIFCKIVVGVIPAAKIYEDQKVLAFLDIAPVNIGHALVIPKKHFKNIYDVPENELAAVMEVVKKISSAVKSLPSDGVNIAMNNDPAAGQIIFHFHVHVIPRISGDGFPLWHGRRPYQGEEMQEVAEKLSQAL